MPGMRVAAARAGAHGPAGPGRAEPAHADRSLRRLRPALSEPAAEGERAGEVLSERLLAIPRGGERHADRRFRSRAGAAGCVRRSGTATIELRTLRRANRDDLPPPRMVRLRRRVARARATARFRMRGREIFAAD